nr:MAG TPA: hypothetical protein [Bacteriophage sp.]
MKKSQRIYVLIILCQNINKHYQQCRYYVGNYKLV